jgi:acetate kinase
MDVAVWRGRRAPTNILVLNAGSSSLKFGIYRMEKSAEKGEREEERWDRGSVEMHGGPPGLFSAEAFAMPQSNGGAPTVERAERLLREPMEGEAPPNLPLHAVGVRVVHGGATFTQATRVTPDVLEEIRSLGRWAPLHNAADADLIEAAQRALPGIPIVAVFDTAFHQTLPEVAFTYALDETLCREHGLRRYGFHGISHRYVSERLSALLQAEETLLSEPFSKGRTVVCHLGNGASVCALKNGVSVDASMGLTPLEGLVMGTRSGDVDPGLLIYLMQSLGRTPSDVNELLNHRSGLRGLSGLSADVRQLEEAAFRGDRKAELALEVFAYRVCKYIGSYAALGGLDAVAFAGGIGERSPSMRRRICRRLDFLGLTLDPHANEAADGQEERRISVREAKMPAWVIPTDEELQIARETYVALV